MLNYIPLDYYALAGLINFFSSLVLSIFVIYKNPKSAINKIFSFFALGASCWGLFHFLWLTTVENARLADFYLRTVMIFVILALATYVYITFFSSGSNKQFTVFNKQIESLNDCDRDTVMDRLDACPCDIIQRGSTANDGCPEGYRIRGDNTGKEDRSCLDKGCSLKKT